MLESKQHARVIALGVVGTVAAFFLFGGATGGGGALRDPIDAVPGDAFLVATVELAELRRSPIYEVVMGKDAKKPGVLDPRELGMGKLSEACGFDPLSRVEKLAVAVPEEGDKGELGVAARGTVTREELSRCTNAVADKRGGKVETKDIGSFIVVEDTSSEGPKPRLGYGHGMVVAGRGAWFDAMLATADGKKKSVRDTAAHVALRSSLTSRPGWASPTVLVSALLPRSLRDRLKNEMAGEANSQQNVMAGVLGVSAVGLALRAGGSGQSLDAAIELVCDDDESCGSVEKLILKKRLDWSKELTLRMIGLGPLLDSIEVKHEPKRVRLTAGASSDGLASTIDRVLRLRGTPRPAPPPGEPKAPPPHEVVPAPH